MNLVRPLKPYEALKVFIQAPKGLIMAARAPIRPIQWTGEEYGGYFLKFFKGQDRCAHFVKSWPKQ